MSDDAPHYRSPGAVATVGEDAERQFEHVWEKPQGWRILSAVNNSIIGRRFIVTGFLFFLAGGVMALLMRTQLMVPENDFLSVELYNQLFTMHGTTMMFLFAVPIMEAFGVYLIPPMIGARDLCFPRLSAFGYWCFLFGGLLLFSSFFFGQAPDGGWFMYVPLVDRNFSPGLNQDFWLLGVTFVEISSIAGAIEIATTILKFRAPGMTLGRMPIFAWYMLAVSFMIIIGFPPLVLASIYLEVQRAFDVPFYEIARGGDPLLWQHLFWIFGHPEVYIIFLPAAGLVSAMLPALMRIRMIGYHLLVLAVVGTAFISFGLWVHHMYATGIPRLALTFFAGASLAVSIPSGIQVFTWIAMLWEGKPQFRTPLLFIIGFILNFVIGGLSGVMVAMVPFDWQVHDTHFVVAHFHYVLIGGMVFPLLAAVTYFVPRASGRLMSERLGHLSFWCVFIGFNVTFFPMHLTGLMGMPRRVATYPAGIGWDTLNLVSTLGSYLIAVGVTLFVVNFLWHYRHGEKASMNPWGASSLEWANESPTPPYNLRSIPLVTSLEPLADQEGLLDRIRDAQEYLPTAEEGKRETLASSVTGGEAQYVARLPHPTFLPLFAALATSGVFIGLLVSLYWLSWLGVASFLLLAMVWLWQAVPEKPAKAVGKGGLVLPIEVNDERSANWVGAVITLLANGAFFAAMVFSHYYLWTLADDWPPPRADVNLAWGASLAAVLAAIALAGAIAAHLAVRRETRWLLLPLLAANLLVLGGLVVADYFAYRQLGLDLKGSAYESTVISIGLYHAGHVLLALLAAGFAFLRLLLTGRHLPVRIFALLSYYLAFTGAVAFGVIFLSPTLLA